MSLEDDFSRTFGDICVLFELSLAVGHSLNIEANCARFLGTLMARKNLGYVALWLRAGVLPPALAGGGGPQELVLVYGVPQLAVQARIDPYDHEAWTQLRARGLVGGTCDDPPLRRFATTQGLSGGAVALFDLPGLGILAVHAGARTQALSTEELNQLETVIRKFCVSLEGCIAHERVVLEIGKRETMEREREAMMEQLHEAQKMEAIGRLAGGVAHDFNNLLLVMQGFAEIAREELSANPTAARQHIDEIIKASNRASDLTGQLLAFSRRGKLRMAALRPNEVTLDVARLVQRTFDPRINLVLNLGLSDEVVVLADASRLHTAILNLVVNARDAMPEGGDLTLCTCLHEHLDPLLLRNPHAASRGAHIEIRVSDTGVGMDAEMVRRIFEPFFTTKELGKGTGLGLAAVYGIAESHGGGVGVQSTPGLGSAFSLFLPVADRRPVEIGETLPAANVPGRLILVVDDQLEARNVLAAMLRHLGHEVLTAEDGIAGLKVFDAHASRIGVVILDVRMPRMGGLETLKALRERAPALPVLIASGFGSEDELQRIQAVGVQGVVEKPFSMAQLAIATSEALEHAVVEDEATR